MARGRQPNAGRGARAKDRYAELRADGLGRRASLEIAGYDLSPALAAAIDGLSLPGRWRRAVRALVRGGPAGGVRCRPRAQRVADAWIAQRRSEVVSRIRSGEPFWNTIEIAECPALLAETTRVLAEAPVNFLQQPLCFACENERWWRSSAGRSSRARGVLIVVGGPQYRVGSHRQFALLANHLAGQGTR